MANDAERPTVEGAGLEPIRLYGCGCRVQGAAFTSCGRHDSPPVPLTEDVARAALGMDVRDTNRPARHHMLCGCIVTCVGLFNHEPRVQFCPLHAEASNLLASLKVMTPASYMTQDPDASREVSDAQEAIRRAERPAPSTVGSARPTAAEHSPQDASNPKD